MFGTSMRPVAGCAAAKPVSLRACTTRAVRPLTLRPARRERWVGMCGKKRKENREGMGNEKSYDDEDMALETDIATMETVAALKEIIAAQREMIQFESKRFSDERKHWQVTNEVHRQQLVAPIPPPLSTLLPPLKELQDDQPLQKREEYLHRRISDLTDRIVELAQGAMSTTAAVALASPATPHPYPAPSEERISTSPSAPSADFAPPPPPSSPTPTAASSNGFSPPLSDLDDAATEAFGSIKAERSMEGDLPEGTEVPSGPPPVLSMGADDIFWMHQLHQALLSKGFYSGQDDMELWTFGDQTLSAVLTFQACSDFEESGVVGEAEWKVLLGPDMMPLRWKEGGGHLGVFPGYSLEAVEGKAMEGGGEETGAEVNGEGVVEDFFARFGGATEVDGEEGGPEERAVEMEAEEGEGEWPTLREGDGGQEVHRMQLALRHAGFYADTEDLQWWQFGPSTMEALKTFQACNGLPETGVCTATVWRKLLGDEDAKPEDMHSIQPLDELEETFEEDLAASADLTYDRVWLIGEQRWEVKKKR